MVVLVTIAVLCTFFGLGVLFGSALFGDHLAERGEYVHGHDGLPSGWLHGSTLFLPEWYCNHTPEQIQTKG